MARCEDCIHEKLCVIKAFPDAFENTAWDKEPCDHFKSSADVAPKSEGKWKPYKDYFTHRKIGWICTNCSAVTRDLSNGDTDYCPHCGAVMETESEEEDE